jgi:peptidyl-prolyl cis-trans isomerase SurA
MRRFVLLILLLQPAFFIFAGKQPKDTTLFTYGNYKVNTREFYKGFTKNKHKDSSVTAAEVDEYLELYKKFKLKVQDAYDQGLDTTSAFKTELATYRKQIARQYLKDTHVNRQLVHEAYERMKYEVKASHILIKSRSDAAPSDTLAAYNKMLEIRKEIESGAITFENAALKYSEDPSAPDNQGNLGYFTVFQMIYEFENFAYSTPVNQVSVVFRTEFGYHILKVYDKRPSKGEISVRQIKIELNPNPSAEEIQESEAKIMEVFKKLQNGEKFTTLVQQYSEDAGSVLKNGELPAFTMTSIRYPENFKNTAFALSNDGDYSQPFQTAQGFHILQRIALKPIDSLKKLENSLLTKINRDSRQYRNTLAVYERAKKIYAFKENKKYLKLLTDGIDTNFLIGSFNAENARKKDTVLFKKVLFTIKPVTKDKSKKAKINFTLNDFAKWLQEVQKPSQSRSMSSILDKYYEVYRIQTIMEYYEADLENINESFASIYKEYKEGILLFSLTEKKVWSKSVDDTTGIKEFYNKNSEKYMFKDRYEASIFRCSSKTIAESLKADLEAGIVMDSIMKKYNRLNPLNISNPVTGKFEQGNNFYANYLFTPNYTGQKYMIIEDPKSSGGYVLIQVHKFMASGRKTLSEARGAVMTDYQNFLEKEWIQSLMTKYPVTVNKESYEYIRSKMIKPRS